MSAHRAFNNTPQHSYKQHTQKMAGAALLPAIFLGCLMRALFVYNASFVRLRLQCYLFSPVKLIQPVSCDQR
ncbi:MAG: hypothetical protein ACRDA1_08200, partial [Plesiomonas shigelloides]